jgi:ferritin-like metal-binding protein YciE
MTANPIPLNKEDLKTVFIHNLNRLYFGKQYLDEHIEELIKIASFNDLQLALHEFGNDVKNQITRMDEIYTLVDETPSDKDCNPIKAIVKQNFCLEEKDMLPIITDMDVILYVQLLEHVNITAYRMMKMIALQLKWTEVTQLLIECFDESMEDDYLFVQISKRYMAK